MVGNPISENDAIFFVGSTETDCLINPKSPRKHIYPEGSISSSIVKNEWAFPPEYCRIITKQNHPLCIFSLLYYLVVQVAA